jgi:hypothetical protein
MKKAYFDKPVNLYELKKTYTDDVEFISDTTSFPLVSGITYEGSLNKVIKGKLRAKDMKKKVDRLLEVYKRRLFRHWDDHVDQLLHKLSLPTTTVQKGGPGSGCTGDNCGRPATGVAEFHEHETEVPQGAIDIQAARPAIKYKGKLYVGKKGEFHSNILDAHQTEFTAPEAKHIDWHGIEYGFVDSDESKNWMNRDEFRERAGTELSEDLAHYQRENVWPQRDEHGCNHSRTWSVTRGNSIRLL